VSDPETTAKGPSRQNVDAMFDRIAPRYDLLNRLLSGRRDVVWRRVLAQNLPARESLHVLDLATGTGDVLLSLADLPTPIARGLGLDFSAGMLQYAGQKVSRHPRAETLALVQGDATCLPVQAEVYDAVTIAFGIRNVLDVDAALREMHRCLKSEGRALLLEFSLPSSALLRSLYLAYFRHVLPRIGAIVSGDSQAYRYLNQTVESFPYGEAFCDLMRNAGFHEVRSIPLTFGIATLYIGDK
jgi:demethylmenaquinone methyltransferase/2-methoxy-6-polyprenyl-1,4-benzoquinol methylase